MVSSFQEYAKTHPDFVPILAKYKLAPGAGTSMPAPTNPAAPATPPAAK
jgi:hypothetical protein